MTGRQKDVDSGYAWVVLAGLFVTDMLLGLLWCSVGMLTSAIVDEIEDDITQASLVAATTLGSSTLLGPISGLLHDRMGHRCTGMVSGVVMLVGLVAASFCSSITGLICTFGLITGFGASLGMNLSGVVPGRYFKKKLSIAYGITQVGGGCGLFLAGPLTLFLLESYQLSGCLLVLAAIMFHVSLVGALIRPNTVLSDKEKVIEIEAKSSGTCPEDALLEARDDSSPVKVAFTKNGDVEARDDSSPVKVAFKEDGDVDGRDDSLPVSVASTADGDVEARDDLSQIKLEVESPDTYQEDANAEARDDSTFVKEVFEPVDGPAQHPFELSRVEEGHALLTDVDETYERRRKDPDRNLSNDSHPSICYKDIRQNCCTEPSIYAKKNQDSSQTKCSDKALESLIELPNAKEITESKKSTKTLNLLKKALYVLKNNGFYVYLISSVFWTLGESSCMVHLPQFAKVKGSTPTQVATLLSGMGITATVGGLLAGFAASDPKMGNMLLNFGFLGMSGIVTLLFPLYSYNYPLQMVYSAVYGVYSQAPWVMVGPICVQLVGVANMGFGYGLAAFSTGIGYMFGPPVASLLYESTGVYDYSYIFAGSCLLVSAFFIALVPMFEKHGEEEKTNPKSGDKIENQKCEDKPDV